MAKKHCSLVKEFIFVIAFRCPAKVKVYLFLSQLYFVRFQNPGNFSSQNFSLPRRRSSDVSTFSFLGFLFNLLALELLEAERHDLFEMRQRGEEKNVFGRTAFARSANNFQDVFLDLTTHVSAHRNVAVLVIKRFKKNTCQTRNAILFWTFNNKYKTFVCPQKVSHSLSSSWQYLKKCCF